MRQDRDIDDARGEEAVTFARALGELKQRGSSLLVVGSVPDEMYVRASTQMLGDPDAERPRRRVVVVPSSGEAGGSERVRRTGPISPEYARMVTREASARSAAAANGSGHPSHAPGPTTQKTLPRTQAADGAIHELGESLSEVIDQFDVVADGLDPAELRLAFDCLPMLLEEYDRQVVFRFLHVLATQIREVRGIGHFHLPQPRTSETVRLFEPLFDAIIELRVDGDELKQRWHFRDRSLVSEWLPLTGPE